MRHANITLTRFLSGDAGHLMSTRPPTALQAVLHEVAASVKTIAAALARGTLGDSAHADSVAGGAALAYSARRRKPGETASRNGSANDASRPEYQLAFDPLNCTWSADVNGSAGSIFSVTRVQSQGSDAANGDSVGDANAGSYGQPDGKSGVERHGEADGAPCLLPGREQAAAGYTIYGPATMLIFTLGEGTHGFTLDGETEEFVLTHPSIRIPEDTGEIAVDASNERFWEPPVRRYVHECREGRAGCRERDFSLRWSDAVVPEVHRILMRGGLFLMPRDYRTRSAMRGRLSAVYDASPLGFLVEQAGGMATTGRERVLHAAPRAFHERMPLILGSANEVARIGRYHREHDLGIDAPFTSPLFRERSLFLPEVSV
ncbi:Fructose-1,6-bisphosphatase class 1 3 [Paraburkholderia piptadeniae]|uniref:Fructose-1,6-bisphosphatase class 1 n=1 Tax=Paraburkholderia piptadeniae TaxID=1701573 RepID=A0A1N7S2Z0_9BURK|nr:class 1 fructose-bisphosphatase [Paraburkholderia piptadeniae]SIT41347.1 Fructose-1,6-bisphosphatase class 1 3 [Paraburkholderia piptadeniae]